jgi:hypothetical protein
MSKTALFLLSLVLVLWLAPSPGLQAQSAASPIAPSLSLGASASPLPAWLATAPAKAPHADAALRSLPPSQPAAVCLCMIACWDQGDEVCCQDRCCRVTCGPPNQ